MSVTLEEWTKRLEQEYLSDFIPSGGAAVKIALAPVERAALIHDSLREAAQRQNSLLVHVDAAKTKVHQIEEIFFAVAQQIDWDGLAENWLRAKFIKKYDIKPEESLRDVQKDGVRSQVERWIEYDIIRNYRMSKEFRIAIAMLCQSAINPQDVSPSDADVIKQWLRGEKANLTALKRVQIFQRIVRQNARLQLNSLAIWLHEAGYGSMTLLLDTAHVMQDVPAGMFPIRYTRASTLDFYEVLRQFIDDTDESKYLLVAVTSTSGMLDHDKRSVDEYDALKMRTADDVHDSKLSNPLNALVRLEEV